MGRKRLITDSFQIVKKRRRDSKEVKEAQSPPNETVTVQAESVLQEDIQPDQLETLKQFDLSWEYGPCTGITRLQRWERAKSLGLSPPGTVRDLLLKHREDSIIMYRSFLALKAESRETVDLRLDHLPKLTVKLCLRWREPRPFQLLGTEVERACMMPDQDSLESNHLLNLAVLQPVA